VSFTATRTGGLGVVFSGSQLALMLACLAWDFPTGRLSIHIAHLRSRSHTSPLVLLQQTNNRALLLLAAGAVSLALDPTLAANTPVVCRSINYQTSITPAQFYQGTAGYLVG
jgi:hypothetical protein